MVVYGGEAPFSMPVAATVDNQIFTDASNIDKALQHVTFSKYLEVSLKCVTKLHTFTHLMCCTIPVLLIHKVR